MTLDYSLETYDNEFNEDPNTPSDHIFDFFGRRLMINSKNITLIGLDLVDNLHRIFPMFKEEFGHAYGLNDKFSADFKYWGDNGYMQTRYENKILCVDRMNLCIRLSEKFIYLDLNLVKGSTQSQNQLSLFSVRSHRKPNKLDLNVFKVSDLDFKIALEYFYNLF